MLHYFLIDMLQVHTQIDPTLTYYEHIPLNLYCNSTIYQLLKIFVTVDQKKIFIVFFKWLADK